MALCSRSSSTLPPPRQSQLTHRCTRLGGRRRFTILKTENGTLFVSSCQGLTHPWRPMACPLAPRLLLRVLGTDLVSDSLNHSLNQCSDASVCQRHRRHTCEHALLRPQRSVPVCLSARRPPRVRNMKNTGLIKKQQGHHRVRAAAC